MLIPRALDVDALIRTVPKGRLITQREIRKILAERAGATTACAITTGIFVWLSAEAAAEEEQAGKKRVTPYWRVVRDDGGLIDRLPGGQREQARRLRDEGHEIVAKGKKLRVASGERRRADDVWDGVRPGGIVARRTVVQGPPGDGGHPFEPGQG
jgi:alkylated DNA nucleotide flippase Atl1